MPPYALRMSLVDRIVKELLGISASEDLSPKAVGKTCMPFTKMAVLKPYKDMLKPYPKEFLGRSMLKFWMPEAG